MYRIVTAKNPNKPSVYFGFWLCAICTHPVVLSLFRLLRLRRLKEQLLGSSSLPPWKCGRTTEKLSGGLYDAFTATLSSAEDAALHLDCINKLSLFLSPSLPPLREVKLANTQKFSAPMSCKSHFSYFFWQWFVPVNAMKGNKSDLSIFCKVHFTDQISPLCRHKGWFINKLIPKYILWSSHLPGSSMGPWFVSLQTYWALFLAGRCKQAANSAAPQRGCRVERHTAALLPRMRNKDAVIGVIGNL